MICWYRRWYSQPSYLHFMAATALALFMLLNVLTLLNLAALLGLGNWVMARAPALPLPVGGVLWAANLSFGYWRSRHPEPRGAAAQSRKPAIRYMVVSFLVFLVSCALLVALKASGAVGF